MYMGFFAKRSEIDRLQSHIDHLDREVHFYKGLYNSTEQKLAHQKEQNDCIKTRVSLCEVILANLLAKNANCIVGWDFYLEKLKEIRSTDPDSNPGEPGPH